VKLFAACAAVLALGAMLAPRNAPEAPASEEKVAPILQAEAERREPARLFRAIQETARRAALHAVAILKAEAARASVAADFIRPSLEPASEAGFGLVVSEDQVLTHVAALAGQEQPRVRFADGSGGSARVVGYEAETGLVLLRMQDRAAVGPPPFATGTLAPGDPVFAAARGIAGDLVAPVFVASIASEGRVTLAIPVPVPGTPIFDLAGEALAVAAGGPSASLAHAAHAAVLRLTSLSGAGRGLPVSLGVLLQPITPELAKDFGEPGVIVSDVAPASPAARAGLEPGDVIVAIGGVEVGDVAAARAKIASLPPAEPVRVAARRRGKQAEFVVEPRRMLEPHLSPALPPPPADAPLARELLPADTLARAAIPEDAVVLAIDGARVAGPAAARALRRAQPPVRLHLQHRGRRFFAVLESAR
jgi:S1-C subfamily serine protease